MEELYITDKQKYLDDNYPFENQPQLNEEFVCIHCDTIFKVSEYKVFRDEIGDEYICCPSAPECDGTVIDWIAIG